MTDARTLDELAQATVALRAAQKARDALILRALAEGHSERSIGRAAGVSGPAINQFKRRQFGVQEPNPPWERVDDEGRRDG